VKWYFNLTIFFLTPQAVLGCLQGSLRWFMNWSEVFIAVKPCESMRWIQLKCNKRSSVLCDKVRHHYSTVFPCPGPCATIPSDPESPFEAPLSDSLASSPRQQAPSWGEASGRGVRCAPILAGVAATLAHCSRHQQCTVF